MKPAQAQAARLAVGAKADYATTFATEAAVIVSTLLVYRVVTIQFDLEGFAQYAVARRTLTLLLPLVVVGLDVALARYVAITGPQEPRKRRAYLLGALLLSAVAFVTVNAFLLTVPDLSATLFFGSADLVPLLLTIPILLAGAALHVVAYGYLRGWNVRGANALMLVNHALLPPLALAVSSESVLQVLGVLGAGWVMSSGLAIATGGLARERLRERTVELLSYGAPRIPGDLMRLLLFGLPVIATAHVATFAEAGMVAFGMTALGMVSSALTPVSFVTLPLAARSLSAGAVVALRRHVLEIVRLVVPLLLAVTLAVEVWAGPLIDTYFGREVDGAPEIMSALMLAALPWGLFVVLKSVIDAADVRPLNTRNIIVAFLISSAIGVLMLLTGSGVIGIVASFVIGSYVLGALTVVDARAVLGRDETYQ